MNPELIKELHTRLQLAEADLLLTMEHIEALKALFTYKKEPKQDRVNQIKARL
jgi:hypothetical protein